jgi:trk system potassium uptake protein TrkA
MFVLIVGCGRVGSAIAKRMIKGGHEVSVLDESEEAHALLDHDLDQTWEDSGGRFTVGTALEVEALDAAGIQQADVVVCSTVVVRVLDPYRADWYSQQGIHTVCPTQVAIEMLTEAVAGDGGSATAVET